LKIIVCAKAVPAYISNPEVPESGDRVNYQASSIIVNESDEYALQEAVSLRKAVGGEVTVMTAGSLSAQKALQIGLARGADEAIRVDANPFEPGRTAAILAEAIERREYDLVLTGVESSDIMAAQVGVLVAEMLGLPFAYAVTGIKPGQSDETLEITKELGAGVKQVVQITLPALLCVQTGAAPLSFVTLRKIVQTQSKPIDTMMTRDLGLEETLSMPAASRILDIVPPESISKSRAEFLTGGPSEVASMLIEKVREVV
jgi:electron transfer flavoprotein beta subunit